MRSLLVFIFISCFVSCVLASKIEMREEEQRLRAPRVSYDDIKPFAKSNKKGEWHEIDFDSHQWHFHWHMANRGNLEEIFSPSLHHYKVVLLDDRGLTHKLGLEESDSVFATYDIHVLEKTTQKVACESIYTFYLVLSKSCKMSH
jgi:hypothetical protein